MAHWQILRMFELFLVGIGTGNPEHITVQARRAIKEADSILIPYKGSEKSELVDVRLKICKEIIKGKNYLFDGRFLIVSNKSGNLISSFGNDLNIINNKSPFYKYKDIINKSIPYLQTLEGKNITPHLNIIDENSNIYKNLDNKPFSLYLINRVSV